MQLMCIPPGHLHGMGTQTGNEAIEAKLPLKERTVSNVGVNLWCGRTTGSVGIRPLIDHAQLPRQLKNSKTNLMTPEGVCRKHILTPVLLRSLFFLGDDPLKLFSVSGGSGGGGVRDRDRSPPPWNVADVTRAMSKGWGCGWVHGACECRSGGVCQFFVGWMTSRRQCPRGVGVLVNVLSPPPLSGNPVSAPVVDKGWKTYRFTFLITTRDYL